MEIVVLNGSPRRGGNTDALVNAFVAEASKRHHVNVYRASDYDIHPCIGCNACFASDEHRCSQLDDMPIIIDALSKADMLVVASPVYFYSISAQLKTLIDRLHNPIRDSFAIKYIGLMCVAASSKPQVFDSIKVQYRLLCDFFDLQDKGMVLAGNQKKRVGPDLAPFIDEARSFAQSI